MMNGTLFGRAAIRGWQALLALLIALSVLGTVPSAQAAGANCTVASSGGSYTTIQAAVNDSSCATIDVAAGTYTENVTIGRDVTITGSTTGSTIVDGNNAGMVFSIRSNTVTLANLTIQHGNSEQGGGIDNWGILTVTNSTISDNSAASGGGIKNNSTLSVANSAILRNYARRYGGGIENSGTLTVTNSTFSGNFTDGIGGGMIAKGHISVTNSTISGNSGSLTGGIFIDNLRNGSLTLINSILSDNHAFTRNANCQGPTTADSRNNLFDNQGNECGFYDGVNGTIAGQNPQLGPLQNNGGPTQTFALLPGSPAIDAGSDADCPAADQRGTLRPRGAHCDIGAYEDTSVPADAIAPTANPSQSPAANSAGWNTGNVTVSWNWSDNAGGSGLDLSTCTASGTTSGQGALLLRATCRDLAGNTGSAEYTVRVDKTAPTLHPVVSPNPVVLGASASVSPNAADSISGVAAVSCGALETASVGTKALTCTATDKAGNQADASVMYQVIYAWSGFLQPVDNLPALNSVKAGSAVPVTFSLGGNQGLNIFAAGSPATKQITCDSGAPVDEIEETVTASASGLQYDAASGQYSYVWKTDKSWGGSCRQLSVTLIDGTIHSANFKFK